MGRRRLRPEELAELRDRLTAELASIPSAEENALAWSIPQPARQDLFWPRSDAQLVETSFQGKLAEPSASLEGPATARKPPRGHPSRGPISFRRRNRPRGYSKAKPEMVGSRPKPYACPATRPHLKFIAAQPCWCAVAHPLTPTTFDLRNLAQWVARSATNSRFPCAVPITAKFTGMVTRPLGGKGSMSTRFRSPSSFGSVPRLTRSQGYYGRPGRIEPRRQPIQATKVQVGRGGQARPA